MTIFTEKDKLTFGKYKGQEIGVVIKDNPEYIDWAIHEIKWFELDEETQELLDESMKNVMDDFGWWNDRDTGGDAFPGSWYMDFD